MATYYVQTDGDNANLGTAVGAANAWAHPGYAAQQMVADDICYVKAGTYNITTVTPGNNGPVLFAVTGVNNLMEGYEATPGDQCPTDNFPLLYVNFTPGSSINIFGAAGGSGKIQMFHCMKADGTSKPNSSYGFKGLYGIYEFAVRCEAQDCYMGFRDIACISSKAYSNTYAGFYACDYVYGCYALSNTFDGFGFVTFAENCISKGNAGRGYHSVSTARYTNCVSYNDGGDGFEVGAVSCATNCISWNAGGYSFDTSIDAVADTFLVNCADDGGTSGRTRGTPLADIGAITLTVDPFTNAAADDFSLNSTTGGGALCLNAGYAAYGQVKRLDIGAVESTVSGGGLLIHPGTSGGMRG